MSPAAVELGAESFCTLRGLMTGGVTDGKRSTISRVGLEMALHGDLDAIELLRAGRRSDPAVRRYLDHLQL